MRSVSVLAKNVQMGDAIRSNGKSLGKVKAKQEFSGVRNGKPYTEVLLVTTTLKTVKVAESERVCVGRPKRNFAS